MSSNKQRIWNNEELTIAYYVSKYGTLNGLNIRKDEIVNYVIGNTSERSFDMQVANFNYLLGIGESQYTDYSKAMVEVVEELKNKTVTQVREIIMNYAISIDEQIAINKTNFKNTEVKDKTQLLNEELNRVYEAKLDAIARSGRRLRPINNNKR